MTETVNTFQQIIQAVGQILKDTAPRCEAWRNRHQKRPDVNQHSEQQDFGTHPCTASSGKREYKHFVCCETQSARCWWALLETRRESYLHGNATTALQVIARVEGDCGCNCGRGAGFQAVAGANQLGQGLQRVDAQLDELTLECERAKRSAGRLEKQLNQVTSHEYRSVTNVARQDTA